MMREYANTTYAPRHAAPSFSTVFKARARAAGKRLMACLRWIDRWMEKDFSGAGLVLCGILMGTLMWAVVFCCYFVW